jgi:hypothetical protein
MESMAPLRLQEENRTAQPTARPQIH